MSWCYLHSGCSWIWDFDLSFFRALLWRHWQSKLCPRDELMVLSGHGRYPAIVFCVALLFSLSPAVSEIEEEVGIEKCSVSVLGEHPVSVRTNPAMQLSLPYHVVSWLAIFFQDPILRVCQTHLRLFFTVLLWVVLSFQGLYDTISNSQTLVIEEKYMSMEDSWSCWSLVYLSGGRVLYRGAT